MTQLKIQRCDEKERCEIVKNLKAESERLRKLCAWAAKTINERGLIGEDRLEELQAAGRGEG